MTNTYVLMLHKHLKCYIYIFIIYIILIVLKGTVESYCFPNT